MITCDAVIVGGGPAGSTCAWHLRQAGLDVTVVDAAVFPRDKVCAGWITPQVLTLLRLDAQAYARGRTFQPFTGFRVGLMAAGKGTPVAYDRAVSYGIRRCEFDHYLLQRAGARVCPGMRVAGIRRDNDQWIVNDSIRAPLLVGAGGAGCPVARLLNGTAHNRPVIVAQEAESRIDTADLAHSTIASEVPELFFCRDLQGYGWCVRKGDFVNVGLGRFDARALPAATAQFVAWLEAAGKIPPRAPWRWRGHSYAVHVPPHRLSVDAGVLLVGDAAGAADPRSGEGIRQAIETGVLAAETIVAADGRYLRDRLEPYRERVRARYGGSALSAAIARVVPDRIKAGVAGELLRLPAFVKRVVIDDWFLQRRQPSLDA